MLATQPVSLRLNPHNRVSSVSHRLGSFGRIGLFAGVLFYKKDQNGKGGIETVIWSPFRPFLKRTPATYPTSRLGSFGAIHWFAGVSGNIGTPKTGRGEVQTLGPDGPFPLLVSAAAETSATPSPVGTQAPGLQRGGDQSWRIPFWSRFGRDKRRPSSQFCRFGCLNRSKSAFGG